MAIKNEVAREKLFIMKRRCRKSVDQFTQQMQSQLLLVNQQVDIAWRNLEIQESQAKRQEVYAEKSLRFSKEVIEELAKISEILATLSTESNEAAHEGSCKNP